MPGSIFENLSSGKLKTNLRTLTYQGSGPYVSKPLPELDEDNYVVRTESATGLSGIIGAGSRNIEDVRRLTKMFVDTPGYRFLNNQEALQQAANKQKSTASAPPIDSIDGIWKKLKASTKKVIGGRLNTQAEILFQAGVSGTGQRLIQGSLISFLGDREYYLGYSQADRTGLNGLADNPDGEKTQLLNTPSAYSLPEIPPYSTTYVNPDTGNIEQVKTGPTYEKLEEYTLQTGPLKLTRESDRKVTTKKMIVNYDIHDRRTPKTLNSQDIITSTSNLTSVAPSNEVVLAFTLINPDSTTYSTYKDKDNRGQRVTKIENAPILYFNAYIDNFADNFQGRWNTTNYIGRGDSFYTYDGFERSFNLSFRIAAANRMEMRPLYRKMQALASATAPTYSKNSFMRGTLLMVTLGDYFHDQYAILENLSYNWNSDYQWETAADKEDKDWFMYKVPQVMDCQISLKLIHTKAPVALTDSKFAEGSGEQYFSNYTWTDEEFATNKINKGIVTIEQAKIKPNAVNIGSPQSLLNNRLATPVPNSPLLPTIPKPTTGLNFINGLGTVNKYNSPITVPFK
jgi:hypothetical protein